MAERDAHALEAAVTAWRAAVDEYAAAERAHHEARTRAESLNRVVLERRRALDEMYAAIATSNAAASSSSSAATTAAAAAAAAASPLRRRKIVKRRLAEASAAAADGVHKPVIRSRTQEYRVQSKQRGIEDDEHADAIYVVLLRMFCDWYDDAHGAAGSQPSAEARAFVAKVQRKYESRVAKDSQHAAAPKRVGGRFRSWVCGEMACCSDGTALVLSFAAGKLAAQSPEDRRALVATLQRETATTRVARRLSDNDVDRYVKRWRPAFQSAYDRFQFEPLPQPQPPPAAAPAIAAAIIGNQSQPQAVAADAAAAVAIQDVHAAAALQPVAAAAVPPQRVVETVVLLDDHHMPTMVLAERPAKRRTLPVPQRTLSDVQRLELQSLPL